MRIMVRDKTERGINSLLAEGKNYYKDIIDLIVKNVSFRLCGREEDIILLLYKRKNNFLV